MNDAGGSIPSILFSNDDESDVLYQQFSRQRNTYHIELTDRFTAKGALQDTAFLGQDYGGTPLEWSGASQAVLNDSGGFSIDMFTIRALGQVNFKVSFFQEDRPI